jgi:hypothetical protein
MSAAGIAAVGTAQVRRSLDRSDHRKPLRLKITRRRAPRRAGGEKFVTQVRFGGAEAVVVPFKGDPGFLTSRPSPAGD